MRSQLNSNSSHNFKSDKYYNRILNYKIKSFLNYNLKYVIAEGKDQKEVDLQYDIGAAEHNERRYKETWQGKTWLHL